MTVEKKYMLYNEEQYLKKYPLAEGYFQIDSLDKDDNVIDHYESKNLICLGARKSMAEIFFKSVSAKYAHRLVIGTQGCKDNQKFKAKTEEDGVVKERTHIFSEIPNTTYAYGTLLENVMKGDIFRVSDGYIEKYYKALKDADTLVLSSDDLESWVETEPPYTYEIGFTMTGIDSTMYDNLCTTGRNDIVKAEQKDTSVVFTFYIDTDNGNKQYVDSSDYDVPTTLFNEAGLYVNDRLFAMRTFPSKIKDESVKLRIIWTITF